MDAIRVVSPGTGQNSSAPESGQDVMEYLVVFVDSILGGASANNFEESLLNEISAGEIGENVRPAAPVCRMRAQRSRRGSIGKGALLGSCGLEVPAGATDVRYGVWPRFI